jgi:tetratricopeptide (TPR) repeat protein
MHGSLSILKHHHDAFALRDEGQLSDAACAFRQLGNAYQAGLCMALLGQVQDAIPDWELLIHKRPQHWCVALFGLMKGQLAVLPTFLGIRLYLEMDVWAMLRANRQDYAMTLTRFADDLQTLHLEAPKLLAKPWLYMGHYDVALPLLHQSLNRLPNDPEAYYHLGHYYDLTHQPEQARLMWQETLMINPHYWPASHALATMKTMDGAPG